MSEQIGGPMNPEIKRTVDRIQFFDLDGVVTDPTEKKVNAQVLEKLGTDLEYGTPVVLETGRGWEWVKKHVIEPLSQKISEPKLLEDVFVSVEKGGVSVTYEDGKWVERVMAGSNLPQDIISSADGLIDKYKNTMSRKEHKTTMYSVEMHDVASSEASEEKERKLREFQAERDTLKGEFDDLVRTHGLADNYHVDPTTIAIDIEPKGVGKRLGTREALDWLRRKGINAGMYEVFGDSKSDVDMAREISDQGLPVKLFFVGDGSQLEDMDLPFETELRSKQYDKGTLEFLQAEG